MKVSAIISTYNSEHFLRGRLDNLLQQTLYARGELEIVVVNAGSKQGDDFIAREYLGCITYIKSLREPIYVSWNRGIAISKGQYITNANTDDRLRCVDALEIMAAELDDNPNVGMVYADARVVGENGEPSTKAPYYGKIEWPDYDPQLLKQVYFGGPNPMWRRVLHSIVGYFDESYQLAGDYEFALRLAAHGIQSKHIPQPLTDFYDDGANINNLEFAGMEARRALLKWRGKIK